MESYPVGDLSLWAVVLVGNCPGGELSSSGELPCMVGCPSGELSWWEIDQIDYFNFF